MNYKVPKNLLTKNNAKTIKGEKYGWTTRILYLSPYKQNAGGINLCSHASNGCAAACLFGSGHGSLNNVEKGRTNKTEYFLGDRKGFLAQLKKEVANAEKLANKNGVKLCIRLNGTSDVPFEKFKVENGKTLMELFPNVQFYDYTKNPFRFNKVLPENYQLTFSRSETNDEAVDKVLASGGNVAVVFDELPETYKGYKVINGDFSDLRFEDEKNVIVGLKYKKLTSKGSDNQEVFKSGFGVRKEELEQVKA